MTWRGFRIGEMVVKHNERKSGKSTYNWKKAFRGFVDMWQIWFWKKYSDRPLHLFGVLGVFTSIAGIVMLVALGVLRFLKLIALASSIWPLVAVLLVVVGMQLFIFGMVLDLLIKNYYAIGKEKSYSIKEIVEV